MAKTLSKGGLKLIAGGPGRRPMVWRVTAPGLSRTYTFTPGVVTYVEPEDRSWFEDAEHTGGRVFEVVPPEAAPVLAAPDSQQARGGRTGASASTGTVASTDPASTPGDKSGMPTTGKD